MTFKLGEEKRKKIVELLELDENSDLLLDYLEGTLDEHYFLVDKEGTIYEEVDLKSKKRDAIRNQLKKLSSISKSSAQLQKDLSKLNPSMEYRVKELVGQRLSHKLGSTILTDCLIALSDICNEVKNDFGPAYKNKLDQAFIDIHSYWVITLKRDKPPMTANCDFNKLLSIIFEIDVSSVHTTRKRLNQGTN
jgi:hypothetical protein